MVMDASAPPGPGSAGTAHGPGRVDVGIHHAERALTGEDARCLLAAAPGHLSHVGRREVGGVGRGDDVAHAEEQVVGGQRLLFPHIERGAGELPAVEGAGQRALDTTGPREVLMRMAVGFIRRKNFSPRM